MTAPTVAELEAATAATAAAIADPDADLVDVYLAAEAEEALYREVFPGPCDRAPRPRTRTGDPTMTVTPEPDLDLSPDTEVYGPQPPALEELWAAQGAPYEAYAAGCSDAEYDRLLTARLQTEAAYLTGYDRDLVRALEAGDAEPELEAEPW